MECYRAESMGLQEAITLYSYTAEYRQLAVILTAHEKSRVV